MISHVTLGENDFTGFQSVYFFFICEVRRFGFITKSDRFNVEYIYIYIQDKFMKELFLPNFSLSQKSHHTQWHEISARLLLTS